MGEKGNAGIADTLAGGSGTDLMATLEALPIDAIKGSPETINAWLDTYLKYREVRELRKANEAAAEAAQSATDAAAIAQATAAGAAAELGAAEKAKDTPPSA